MSEKISLDTVPEQVQMNGISEHYDCDSAVTGKRKYKKIEMIPVAIEMEQQMLTGSNTNVSIEIKNVEVKEFEDDTSFPVDGYDVSFN